MTSPTSTTIWTGNVDDIDYRLVDLGAGAALRFVLQQKAGPNATGEHWWQDVNLPLASVLESAFTSLFAGR